MSTKRKKDTQPSMDDCIDPSVHPVHTPSDMNNEDNSTTVPGRKKRSKKIDHSNLSILADPSTFVATGSDLSYLDDTGHKLRDGIERRVILRGATQTGGAKPRSMFGSRNNQKLILRSVVRSGTITVPGSGGVDGNGSLTGTLFPLSSSISIGGIPSSTTGFMVHGQPNGSVSTIAQQHSNIQTSMFGLVPIVDSVRSRRSTAASSDSAVPTPRSSKSNANSRNRSSTASSSRTAPPLPKPKTYTVADAHLAGAGDAITINDDYCIQLPTATELQSFHMEEIQGHIFSLERMIRFYKQQLAIMTTREQILERRDCRYRLQYVQMRLTFMKGNKFDLNAAVEVARDAALQYAKSIVAEAADEERNTDMCSRCNVYFVVVNRESQNLCPKCGFYDRFNPATAGTCAWGEDGGEPDQYLAKSSACKQFGRFVRLSTSGEPKPGPYQLNLLRNQLRYIHSMNPNNVRSTFIAKRAKANHMPNVTTFVNFVIRLLRGETVAEISPAVRDDVRIIFDLVLDTYPMFQNTSMKNLMQKPTIFRAALEWLGYDEAARCIEPCKLPPSAMRNANIMGEVFRHWGSTLRARLSKNGRTPLPVRMSSCSTPSCSPSTMTLTGSSSFAASKSNPHYFYSCSSTFPGLVRASASTTVTLRSVPSPAQTETDSLPSVFGVPPIVLQAGRSKITTLTKQLESVGTSMPVLLPSSPSYVNGKSRARIATSPDTPRTPGCPIMPTSVLSSSPTAGGTDDGVWSTMPFVMDLMLRFRRARQILKTFAHVKAATQRSGTLLVIVDRVSTMTMPSGARVSYLELEYECPIDRSLVRHRFQPEMCYVESPLYVADRSSSSVSLVDDVHLPSLEPVSVMDTSSVADVVSSLSTDHTSTASAATVTMTTPKVVRWPIGIRRVVYQLHIPVHEMDRFFKTRGLTPFDSVLITLWRGSTVHRVSVEKIPRISRAKLAAAALAAAASPTTPTPTPVSSQSVVRGHTSDKPSASPLSSRASTTTSAMVSPSAPIKVAELAASAMPFGVDEYRGPSPQNPTRMPVPTDANAGAAKTSTNTIVLPPPTVPLDFGLDHPIGRGLYEWGSFGRVWTRPTAVPADVSTTPTTPLDIQSTASVPTSVSTPSSEPTLTKRKYRSSSAGTPMTAAGDIKTTSPTTPATVEAPIVVATPKVKRPRPRGRTSTMQMADPVHCGVVHVENMNCGAMRVLKQMEKRIDREFIVANFPARELEHWLMEAQCFIGRHDTVIFRVRPNEFSMTIPGWVPRIEFIAKNGQVTKTMFSHGTFNIRSYQSSNGFSVHVPKPVAITPTIIKTKAEPIATTTKSALASPSPSSSPSPSPRLKLLSTPSPPPSSPLSSSSPGPHSSPKTMPSPIRSLSSSPQSPPPERRLNFQFESSGIDLTSRSKTDTIRLSTFKPILSGPPSLLTSSSPSSVKTEVMPYDTAQQQTLPLLSTVTTLLHTHDMSRDVKEARFALAHSTPYTWSIMASASSPSSTVDNTNTIKCPTDAKETSPTKDPLEFCFQIKLRALLLHTKSFGSQTCFLRFAPGCPLIISGLLYPRSPQEMDLHIVGQECEWPNHPWLPIQVSPVDQHGSILPNSDMVERDDWTFVPDNKGLRIKTLAHPAKERSNYTLVIRRRIAAHVVPHLSKGYWKRHRFRLGDLRFAVENVYAWDLWGPCVLRRKNMTRSAVKPILTSTTVNWGVPRDACQRILDSARTFTFVDDEERPTVLYLAPECPHKPPLPVALDSQELYNKYLRSAIIDTDPGSFRPIPCSQLQRWRGMDVVCEGVDPDAGGLLLITRVVPSEQYASIYGEPYCLAQEPRQIVLSNGRQYALTEESFFLGMREVDENNDGYHIMASYHADMGRRRDTIAYKVDAKKNRKSRKEQAVNAAMAAAKAKAEADAALHRAESTEESPITSSSTTRGTANHKRKQVSASVPPVPIPSPVNVDSNKRARMSPSSS